MTPKQRAEKELGRSFLFLEYDSSVDAYRAVKEKGNWLTYRSKARLSVFELQFEDGDKAVSNFLAALKKENE